MTEIRNVARKALLESAAWEVLCDQYMINTGHQAMIAEGLVNAVLRAVADAIRGEDS